MHRELVENKKMKNWPFFVLSEEEALLLQDRGIAFRKKGSDTTLTSI
jgi:hypothetical protein